MLTEQNKATVLDFYKAFDDRQMDRALKLLAPNFSAHLAGIPELLDSEGFKRLGMAFYLAFANGEHVFDEVIVAGDKVVTCGIFTATHLGEFQSLPPTGKQIKLSIMHIDRLEDGKIVEHSSRRRENCGALEGDALGLMQQLGIVFLPGPKLIPHILKGIVSRLFQQSASSRGET
ncbi:MAG: ester cyclase [Microcoleus sp. PH2017_29_MFU_D_A]|uniref:ester cyclase n=1 Tax=unclassified Microcoleus TaxID=2642155 RepID=UPI001E03EC35|nr:MULTISPECIES: ester cyclase [unclassified Microcoleus]TAG68655.1 MAG: ester cyclase [Oscillatoriales cyanobacterium]MCC3425147.1 ester cyclase [Microcoleus sp. PH2017_01_SCD_O_A]MCC3454809.1 ester cyclase [Microcoleus sp. PH2017_08_TRC_O_A]MCC3588587.1 ester cyclase [Microcoleus sp. PH2017_30_WIL_O_A]MCC3602285.1 ester cyclase [Microcoleus sp. PH2017_29_MFU_D_A]